MYVTFLTVASAQEASICLGSQLERQSIVVGKHGSLVALCPGRDAGCLLTSGQIKKQRVWWKWASYKTSKHPALPHAALSHPAPVDHFLQGSSTNEKLPNVPKLHDQLGLSVES